VIRCDGGNVIECVTYLFGGFLADARDPMTSRYAFLAERGDRTSGSSRSDTLAGRISSSPSFECLGMASDGGACVSGGMSTLKGSCGFCWSCRLEAPDLLLEAISSGKNTGIRV
jgi:hypothetical protein